MSDLDGQDGISMEVEDAVEKKKDFSLKLNTFSASMADMSEKKRRAVKVMEKKKEDMVGQMMENSQKMDSDKSQFLSSAQYNVIV